MEKNYHLSSSSSPDASALEAFFPAIPFQSLLAFPYDIPFPPLYTECAFPAHPLPFDLAPPASPPHLPLLPNPEPSVPDAAPTSALKTPKLESLQDNNFPDSTTQFFNFLSGETLPFVFDSAFHQLPPLQSLESSSASSSTQYSQSLSSFLQSYPCGFPANSPPPQVATSQARNRRQKKSDKIRCLQKLMPWDKKMDIATMLQEAYKYVQFLQAQIKALEAMPLTSTFGCDVDGSSTVFGGLGQLNRQQLLQVLVNSPAAQTVLYSRGCCVVSFEQLVFLKKIAEMKVAQQQNQMSMFDPSKSSQN